MMKKIILLLVIVISLIGIVLLKGTQQVNADGDDIPYPIIIIQES